MSRRSAMVRASMRRAGSTGVAPSTAISWEQFRRPDLGAAWVDAPTNYDDTTSTSPLTGTPVYPWGYNGTPIGGTNMSNQPMNSGFILGSSLGANVIIAMAQVLPPGTIRRLVIGQQDGVGTAPVGSRVRLGIWTNRGTDDALYCYPATQIYDSGDINMESLGARNTGAIAVPVDGGLYWASLSVNATGAGVRVSMMTASQFRPVGGMTVRWGNGEPSYNRSLIVAWRHAQAYGALPSTFPNATPVKCGVPDSSGTAWLPLLHYGFDPS